MFRTCFILMFFILANMIYWSDGINVYGTDTQTGQTITILGAPK